MFKIECLCDDRKLPEVLKTLDGLVYRLSANPVTDAEQMNGHARLPIKRTKPNYEIWPKLKKSVSARKKGTKLRFSELGEIARKAGMTSQSHSAYVERLVREKIVKKTGETGIYERI